MAKGKPDDNKLAESHNLAGAIVGGTRLIANSTRAQSRPRLKAIEITWRPICGAVTLSANLSIYLITVPTTDAE